MSLTESIGRSDGRQALSDDGTVVTAAGLLRDGQIIPVSWNGRLLARISADGSTLVFETATFQSCLGGALFKAGWYTGTLDVVHVSTGTTLRLETNASLTSTTPGPSCDARPYYQPSISNDGRRVLFRWSDSPSGPQQAVVARIASARARGGRRVLTAEPSGIVEVVLSGDGHLAFAVTGGGGLLSINVDSGSVERLLPNAGPW